MEVAQCNKEKVQAIPSDSDIVLDGSYTFLFRTGGKEKVRVISAQVLQQFPNCMFTRMVNSQLNTEKSTEGGYIIKERNLDMVDHITNFMQNNFFKYIFSFNFF